MVLYQTGTKLGEHRGVTSRIREFQAQKVFPIDPSTHCISRLLIG